MSETVQRVIAHEKCFWKRMSELSYLCWALRALLLVGAPRVWLITRAERPLTHNTYLAEKRLRHSFSFDALGM